MITVNCDIGERGHDHPVDVELMRQIGIANIACGGHAGDAQSVASFRALAEKYNVQVAAHLSYPDRENFGRTSMQLPPCELLAALDEQYALMDDVKTVKFHGALYNDSWVSQDLARTLAGWLKDNAISAVICPFDSQMAAVCHAGGIKVVPEAFAERRYAYSPADGRLTLVSRTKDYASIHDLDEALRQAARIIRDGLVDGYIEKAGGAFEIRTVPIQATTICIHSDSRIALELARRLAVLEG